MQRQRRSSVLEQAEAQAAGAMGRNAIKKQVLLGGRKISGELSRVTSGESWDHIQ